ncbi:olfactory receptor 6N1-like [Plectropomus leopardus]|uniref:olfactory receptor 6N1-like n=1 Tax=Plectropomus leopardus TaxID=160734 RepID=UPI001C4BDCD3|nr:olfactory receptor 6N1-like [Plectropomus leopardus]
MNISSVVLFTLSGFGVTVNYRVILFSLTLLCYILIVVVNVSLVLTIILDQNLHEPMYAFLCSLCINGLYGTVAFYPKFVFDLLSDIQVISYAACFVQVFVIYSYATGDFSILALMAYDRYVAICRPLEYHSVMSVRKTAVLISLSWVVPLCCQVMVVSLTSTLKLCGSRIDKLYCENWAIVKLACGTTRANSIVGLVVIAFYCAHVLLIACSYVQLVMSSLSSREGRRKFMQTCVPHLLCLLNVTAALLFDTMYSRYGTASMPRSLRNFMALHFLVMPPILNPIIYGLILTKIRKRVGALLSLGEWVARSAKLELKLELRQDGTQMLEQVPSSLWANLHSGTPLSNGWVFQKVYRWAPVDVLSPVSDGSSSARHLYP